MHKPRNIRRPSRFWPWFWFLLTLASAYVFFVLPHQLGKREVKVEFVAK